MEIKTNHQYRPVLYWDELTNKEKSEYDFDGAEESTYFRYRGWAYTLEDFMVLRHDDPGMPFKGWDAYRGDSFFSGVVIKMSDCGEAVMVGRYMS
jgi:hypothetical protein